MVVVGDPITVGSISTMNAVLRKLAMERFLLRFLWISQQTAYAIQGDCWYIALAQFTIPIIYITYMIRYTSTYF